MIGPFWIQRGATFCVLLVTSHVAQGQARVTDGCVAPGRSTLTTRIGVPGSEPSDSTSYSRAAANAESTLRRLPRTFRFVDVGTEGADRYVRWGTANLILKADARGRSRMITVRGVRRSLGPAAASAPANSFDLTLLSTAGGEMRMYEIEAAGGRVRRRLNVLYVSAAGALYGRWDDFRDGARHDVPQLDIPLVERSAGYFCLLPSTATAP